MYQGVGRPSRASWDPLMGVALAPQDTRPVEVLQEFNAQIASQAGRVAQLGSSKISLAIVGQIAQELPAAIEYARQKKPALRNLHSPPHPVRPLEQRKHLVSRYRQSPREIERRR